MKYSTANFYLAVWFMTRGLIPSVEYEQGGDKANFVFDITNAEAKVHIQEFYQDEIVQEFIEGIRKLKSELYANKEPKHYEK